MSKNPGGYLTGQSHEEGGIKIKTPEGMIEAEGGESIINKRSMASKEEVVCIGNPKQVASNINQIGGGVQFAEGGGCFKKEDLPEDLLEKLQGFDRKQEYNDISVSSDRDNISIYADGGILKMIRTAFAIKKETPAKTEKEVKANIKNYQRDIEKTRDDYRNHFKKTGEFDNEEYLKEIERITDKYEDDLVFAVENGIYVPIISILVTQELEEKTSRNKKSLKLQDVKRIESILKSDDLSSDEELIEFFMDDLGLSKIQAEAWVDKRNVYLTNPTYTEVYKYGAEKPKVETFFERNKDKEFEVFSSKPDYPRWIGNIYDIKSYLEQSKDLIDNYDPEDIEGNLKKLNLNYRVFDAEREKRLNAVIEKVEKDDALLFRGGGSLSMENSTQRKIKGKNFTEQIENNRKFKELLLKAYQNQPQGDVMPIEFLQEIALSKNAIVSHHGMNSIKNYLYKGSLTNFTFLDDPNFVEALKYVEGRTIRKFDDGGLVFDEEGKKIIVGNKVTDGKGKVGNVLYINEEGTVTVGWNEVQGQIVPIYTERENPESLIVLDSDNQKIVVSFYKWGEYVADEEMDLKDLPDVLLGEDELLGFNIREEDEDKDFYADEMDIDDDEDGISVKRSYAIDKKHRKFKDGGDTKSGSDVIEYPTLEKVESDEDTEVWMSNVEPYIEIRINFEEEEKTQYTDKWNPSTESTFQEKQTYNEMVAKDYELVDIWDGDGAVIESPSEQLSAEASDYANFIFNKYFSGQPIGINGREIKGETGYIKKAACGCHLEMPEYRDGGNIGSMDDYENAVVNSLEIIHDLPREKAFELSVKANNIILNDYMNGVLDSKKTADKIFKKFYKKDGGDLNEKKNEAVYEEGVMISKPYYYEDNSSEMFPEKGFRIDNKFADNVYASFNIISGLYTKKQALDKANRFYNLVKIAKTRQEYDSLVNTFIANERNSTKYRDGGDVSSLPVLKEDYDGFYDDISDLEIVKNSTNKLIPRVDIKSREISTDKHTGDTIVTIYFNPFKTEDGNEKLCLKVDVSFIYKVWGEYRKATLYTPEESTEVMISDIKINKIVFIDYETREEKYQAEDYIKEKISNKVVSLIENLGDNDEGLYEAIFGDYFEYRDGGDVGQSDLKKKYDELSYALYQKKVPCKIKLTDRDIIVELGFNYPYRLADKVIEAYEKLGISSDKVNVCAESSGDTVLESQRIMGGVKRYDNGGGVGKTKRKYLVALPSFPNSKGFNHRTILVSAIDENEAAIIAKHLKPHDNIGDIKEVNYSNGGGVGSSEDKVWQIKKGNKYYSIGLEDGKSKWFESPDLGYSYDYESAEKLANHLRKEHPEIEIVKYDKDWWKKEDGGGIGKEVSKDYDQYKNGGIYSNYVDLDAYWFDKFKNNYEKIDDQHLTSKERFLGVEYFVGFQKGKQEADWKYDSSDMRLYTDMNTYEVGAIARGSIRPRLNRDGGTIAEEIEKGVEVELEHKDTIEKIKNNPDISVEKAAEMIAKDHIAEDPNYYSNPKDYYGKKVKTKEGFVGEVKSIENKDGKDIFTITITEGNRKGYSIKSKEVTALEPIH